MKTETIWDKSFERHMNFDDKINTIRSGGGGLPSSLLKIIKMCFNDFFVTLSHHSYPCVQCQSHMLQVRCMGNRCRDCFLITCDKLHTNVSTEYESP
jgi:hypothetical protein